MDAGPELVIENGFSLTLVYRRTERWLGTDPEEAGREVEVATNRRRSVQVRGVYSVAGLRADADTAFWLLGTDLAELQAAAADVRRTQFGRACDLAYAFCGVAHRPEFVGDHVAAFQLGRPPLGYLCLYPFVRQPDWYLLSDDERGRLLRDHGALGRDFTDVQTNTVQGFGLGDWEWILAFESDRPERFTALLRRLRAAEARRWTKIETPFIVGRRTTRVADALRDLG